MGHQKSRYIKHEHVNLLNQLLRLVTIIFGVAAAYFLSLQSIKLELSKKAESDVVTKLDKKLTNIEVILSEGVLDKEEFYHFSNSLEKRLTKIEAMIAEKNGR